MFLIIKKSQIFLACLTVLLLFLSVGIYNSADTVDVAIADKNLIVIDAGHGGMDGGAVGTTGLLEKDVNLKVAVFLKELAEADGKKVVMTRETDTSLHTTDSAKIRNQKRSDLENRKKLLQENSSGVFVSIHMNKFEQASVKGAQTFYANNDASRMLAENIQNCLREGIADGNKRIAKPAPENLYIFKGCNSTAVVVECGFLSNSEEEKLLATEDYQKKLAKCIYNGICK